MDLGVISEKLTVEAIGLNKITQIKSIKQEV